MALSLQNLFCSGEDFDDEEFLCALEDTESSFSSSHKAPLRLRPIPARDAQVPGDRLAAQQTDAARGERRPKGTASTSSASQDVDDEELLSVCSELESGVSQEPCQIPDTRLRSSNWTSLQSSSHSSRSPAFQLRPSRRSHCADPEPGTFQGCIPATDHMQPQPYGFNTTSCMASDFSPHARGRGQCQSPGPSAKKPCLRSSLEAQPVTPARAGTHLAQSVYPRCSTPAGSSWQGGLASTPPTLRTPQMSSRTHQCSTLQTPLVTNHLVQLVTAANKTPQKLTWETPPPKERRFPGPAGLLPQQGSVRRLDEILVSPPHTPSHGARARARTKVTVPSQEPVGAEYAMGPWATMKVELSLDENDPACFLRTYSVVMVLRKAALKQLPKNKVPRMAVALKSLTPANGDASAVFRDATGEIQGTVHHLLLEERESELKVGSVLLLQQVGVFSPSHRNHYLNVTPSNLVQIYPPAGAGGPKAPVTLMMPEEASINTNQSQTRCSQQTVSSLSSSIAPPGVSQSVTSQPLRRTAQAGTIQPSFNIKQSDLPQPPAHPTFSHPSVPHPVSFQSSIQHCTALPSAARPSAARPSAAQPSTARPRPSQTAASGDWEMDDLDSLLCDLPEDTGD